ncbi:amidase family protein [Sulfitobacter sp. F26169L]|uniref:amidase family protein n=1 Tax=Sulfitobacter sp. F26169L TaxID=2996015 RepID=UPI002260D86E|nr:amidase family protein [Sulfitobacter sp. F26169L]MCX7567992.1 amidase family protein [Sulfitobacter sp. F26169L]
MSDLWRMSATEIAAAVRSKQLTAVEVTQAHLTRIAAVNPAINAVVQEFPEEALAAAREVDMALARGEEPGLLCGVPVTIKVNVDQKGHATTNGLKLQKDLVADSDSPVVTSIRAAGGVIVGRTNTPAFSLRWFTKNDLHGQTLNPRDGTITPGGSSGGASAAVAAGMCAIGQGTDIAGSIRYPAYACGLHGLRPTFGRIATYNATAADRHIGAQLMAVSGPIARTIPDIALSLAAMSAADARDPWWVPVPLDHGAFPKRAALTVAPDGLPVSEHVEAALRDAAKRLQDAGWIVEEVACPPMRAAAAINEHLWMTETGIAADALIEQEGDADAQFVYAQMKSRIKALDVEGMLTTLQSRVSLIRSWQQFMENYAVLICPVSGELPFAQQQDVSSESAFEAMMEAQLTQRALPVLGLPGLAVATGTVGKSPVGVQLIAGRFREDILLAAGADIENAGPRVTVCDPG